MTRRSFSRRNFLQRSTRRRSTRRQRHPEVNCREVGRILQSYLDGAVEPEFSELIAAHLKKCKDCGLEHETYLQIRNSLAESSAPIDEAAIDRLRAFGRKLAG